MHKERSAGVCAAEASVKRLSWSSLVQKLSHSLDSDSEGSSIRDAVSDSGKCLCLGLLQCDEPLRERH